MLLGLFLIAGICFAQSLAEVAEKERERRQNLLPSKMISDEDLEASGGKNVSLVGKETDQRTVAEVLDGEDGRPDEASESDWPEVLADCQARYDTAKNARNERLYLVQKGFPIGADLERIPCSMINARGFLPGWIRYFIDCERLAEEVQEKQALMDEIQESASTKHESEAFPLAPPGFNSGRRSRRGTKTQTRAARNLT